MVKQLLYDHIPYKLDILDKTWWYEEELVSATKYQVGNVFVDKNDSKEVKILAIVNVLGKTYYITSYWDNLEKMDRRLESEDYFDDYKLKNDAEVEKAMKVLEKAGKIKDGKIITNE